MEMQKKGVGKVDDEITGRVSQERCTYAWVGESTGVDDDAQYPRKRM